MRSQFAYDKQTAHITSASIAAFPLSFERFLCDVDMVYCWKVFEIHKFHVKQTSFVNFSSIRIVSEWTASHCQCEMNKNLDYFRM